MGHSVDFSFCFDIWFARLTNVCRPGAISAVSGKRQLLNPVSTKSVRGFVFAIICVLLYVNTGIYV